MKTIHLSSILFALAAIPFAAVADRDKDDSGHGKHRQARSEYKHEYRGDCKVERKLEKD